MVTLMTTEGGHSASPPTTVGRGGVVQRLQEREHPSRENRRPRPTVRLDMA